MIVNASLNACQVDSLLKVHIEHRKAVGYILDDLKGIHPFVCMHLILMEDDHNPSIEHQRRLNQIYKSLSRRKYYNFLRPALSTLSLIVSG